MKLIIVICIVFWNLGCLCHAISWSLKTKPAVFGKDIELNCTLDGAPTDKNRQWSKGENVNVVVVNGKTINDTKYVEKFNEATRSSVLTIKSMDIDDVNIPYTCHYGFNQYRDILNMTIENYEYHPVGSDSFFHHNSTELLLTMVFDKVYPVPKCSAFYGETNVSDKLTMASVPNNEFFNVGISLHYHHISTDCVHHALDLVCFVGTKKILQRFETSADICLEDHPKEAPGDLEKDQTLGHIGYAIYAVITVFYTVVLPCTFGILLKGKPASELR